MIMGMTDAEIRALKPKEKPYKVRVDRGLYIHIQPGGSKLWRFRYVGRDGVDHTLSLGDYPRVTLAEARRKAEISQTERKDGKDPAALRVVRSRTFEVVAREWWDLQRPRWKPKHAADIMGTLESDAFPIIGKILIDEITAPNILRVVRAIEPRSVDLARRMRQRLEAICAYAIATGYAVHNPAAQIVKAMSPSQPGGRLPAILDIDAAREMLRRVESLPAFPTVKAANRFIALTAVRLGEARFMRWDEVQGDVWELSALRMKMGRPHRVPLSPAALEILEAMRPVSGHTEHVFLTSKGGVAPMGDNSIGAMLNRAGYKGLHCPHGWRSTFSTYWNDRGGMINGGVLVKDAVEHALAHASDDQVAAAYNRGTFFDARRVLMDDWAGVLLDGALPLAEALNGARK